MTTNVLVRKEMSAKFQYELPQPEPAAGKEYYKAELAAAIAFSDKRRENYERYQTSVRRSAKVDYMPTIMDIENVSRCNFRCIMCLTNDFKNGKRAKDMSLDSFKQLIDAQFGLIEIKLHGMGEPVLQGDTFFEMIRYARSKRIWVRTVTNASILHLKDNYKKLVDTDINEIQISIDGATKETFEKVRRLSNFDRVKENCKLINAYSREQNKLRTKMWTVVQRENIAELEALVHTAAELGFSNQVFSLNVMDWGTDILARSNIEKGAVSSLDNERLFALVDLGKKLNVKVYFWNIFSKYSNKTPQSLCPWPFERAYIGSDMRTVPCSMIATPDSYEIANGKSFTDAWFSDEYAAFRQSHIDGRPPTVCQGCYVNKSE